MSPLLPAGLSFFAFPQLPRSVRIRDPFNSGCGCSGGPCESSATGGSQTVFSSCLIRRLEPLEKQEWCKPKRRLLLLFLLGEIAERRWLRMGGWDGLICIYLHGFYICGQCSFYPEPSCPQVSLI
ncbi:unnamed protein product [Larinioides sclopetarius]|uniref:Uncharacterized protein n=1 Tax=Larinioides sclopetarius TaxID=280406 RepID=A0AAV2BYI3_9ARAC